MHRRLYQLAAALLVCVMFAGTAAALDRADCERDFKPQTGQSGKDVVWVPTGDDVVTGMLKMAKAGPNDLVIDLGAGDGKIAIAAAQQFGARAKGIEYNPDMVKLATRRWPVCRTECRLCRATSSKPISRMPPSSPCTCCPI